jgi:DNA-binding NarL/FixJ family response regulator
MTSVVVVDDQELVRAGFRLILERGGVEVLGEAADGVEAIDLVQRVRPDVVLMDLRMPRLDGIEACRRILTGPPPHPRILALTTFDLDEYVYRVVRAGASGFLLKDVSPAELVRAVEVVARGEVLLAPTVTARLLEQFTTRPLPGALPVELSTLTERELEITRLVASGRSNAEIGKALFLSDATVKTYVSRLLAKLGLRDRLQVALLAYETGLLSGGGSPGPAVGGGGAEPPTRSA